MGAPLCGFGERARGPREAAEGGQEVGLLQGRVLPLLRQEWPTAPPTRNQPRGGKVVSGSSGYTRIHTCASLAKPSCRGGGLETDQGIRHVQPNPHNVFTLWLTCGKYAVINKFCNRGSEPLTRTSMRPVVRIQGRGGNPQSSEPIETDIR